MNTYEFDVKFFVVLSVEAESLSAARAKVKSINGNEANFGAWPDGSPIVGVVDMDGEPDLTGPASVTAEGRD